jgi:hypothetical protein
MKKTNSSVILATLLFLIHIHSASAFSFLFTNQEESTPRVERFVSSLFQSGNKTGAASVGEISTLSFATSTDTIPNAITIQTKQRSQTMAISSETKVRKFGIPANIEDMRVGDKVSVVSSISKTETPRLRARVVSILSQANEIKSKPDVIEIETASSTEGKNEVKSASTTEELISKDKNEEVGAEEKEIVKEGKVEEKPLPKAEALRKIVK